MDFVWTICCMALLKWSTSFWSRVMINIASGPTHLLTSKVITRSMQSIYWMVITPQSTLLAVPTALFTSQPKFLWLVFNVYLLRVRNTSVEFSPTMSIDSLGLGLWSIQIYEYLTWPLLVHPLCYCEKTRQEEVFNFNRQWSLMTSYPDTTIVQVRVTLVQVAFQEHPLMYQIMSKGMY